jgi:urease accessory protein
MAATPFRGEVIPMAITTEAAATAADALLSLMQLVSPALPIGAFAYSQGLETVIERGWVESEEAMAEWLHGVMSHSLSALEVPVLVRLYAAWQQNDEVTVEQWNDFLLASRETAELAEEERQLGRALARLLRDLNVDGAEPWSRRGKEPTLGAMFALAACRWQVPLADALRGFLWAWCENQVAAAVKLIPLGQTAGQRLLLQVRSAIAPAVAAGMALADDEIGQAPFGLSMASAWHESQYSRLFRS